VADHRLGYAFDVTGDLTLSALTQALRIASQCCERRLEAVGKIGGTTARALQLPVLRVEQGIDLLDKGLNLNRSRRCKMMNTASADIRDASPQCAEWLQPETNLPR
jgi:hypothetical protein